jgi:hypothetical protein
MDCATDTSESYEETSINADPQMLPSNVEDQNSLILGFGTELVSANF